MLKPLASSILNKIPPVAEILRKRRMFHYFPVEMGLLSGRISPRSDKPSVLFLTHHKCASVYTRELMRDLAIESELLHVDYDAAVFGGEFTREDGRRIHDMHSPELYPTNGCCFAPIRAWHAGYGSLDPYRVILMVRDPRDALVSFYFSMTSSHVTPDTENTAMQALFKERSAAAFQRVDDYVLEKSADVLDTFGNYLRYAVGHPSVLIVTYEEMIANYGAWLDKIIKHAGFTPTPEAVTRYIGSAPRPKKSENPDRHIRQITPGDHRRKLRPETINELNLRFADSLKAFGYSV